MATSLRNIRIAILLSLLAGCASSPTPLEAEARQKEPLLDRTQRAMHGAVHGTAQMVDNIFGSASIEEEVAVSRGRVAVGGQWDERDGLKERLRLRARFALPALEERASLLIGRGDAADLVDGSGDDNIDTLPDRFNDFADEDWLVGIGYSRDGTMQRGWDFGAGVRLGSPLEPYVRATYHWNKGLGERWLWRLRPRVFWQSQRGAGISLQNTLDYAATERWLFRSWSILVVDEEVQGFAWTSKLIAYQNLSDKSAISYGVFATGEPEAEVTLQNYGVELRFRRQLTRDWLFAEFLTFVSWPRELEIERRETNLGFGIEIEMQFGDWPGRPQR